MRFLLALAVLLLSAVFAQLRVDSTITVLSTTLITITSCHPTATDCPGREGPLLSSSITILPPAPPSLSPPSSSSPSSCLSQRCNADNCLRAFERGQGQQFCSTFTQSVVTDTAGLPSYTTLCAGSTISRVSSACSCLNNACIKSSSIAVQSISNSCNADNCVRAFERGEGQAFCSTFTQSIVTRTDGLPTYATECTGSIIARVSSACSCLSSKTSATSSASSNPASVNTHTSQQTFSTPASINTHTSQALSTPAASGGSQQTASASVLVASSGESSSAQVFSITSVWTNSAGSVVTSVIQTTLAPSTASPIKSTQSSVPTSSQQSSRSLQVFSFTTTGINASGSSSSVIVATLTPSQSSAQSVASVTPSQPAPSSAEVFSFTSTGTNAQGSPFTTIIVATAAPSSSGTASGGPSLQPFSFTSTGTNAQGSPFTTIIVATAAPSSSGIASAVPSLQPFSFTSTGVNAQGSTFTTVIQGTTTPSGDALPFASSETLTNAQGSEVISVLTGFGFPFTSTLIGTNNGIPFTSLFTGVRPGGSFTGFPSPTGPSPTSSFPLSIPLPTVTPATACSPFPTCMYPAATDIPTTCSPFPACLLGAIPSSVQSELSWNCGTTSLIQCILGEPDATCNQWPECLTTAIGTDICEGFPFPDCLFTLYNPIVTSTVTTDPPGLTSISTSIPGLTSNTVTKTKDSNGVVVWWPVFAWPGCPECGGTDWILGNLASDFSFPFNVDFTLPGFPEIPEFHFPCIFFCSRSSPNDNPVPPVNDPDQNKDEPTSKEPSRTSKSSSSSSSCAATVTDCSTLLQISISGTVSTTVTSVGCAPVVTQCSQRGSSTTTLTTTSASSTPTYYMITPDPSKDFSVLNAFTNRLMAETDPNTLWTVDAPDIGLVVFWKQALNSTQVQEYLKDPAVVQINSTEPEIDFDDWVDDLPDTTIDGSLSVPPPSRHRRRDDRDISDYRHQIPRSIPQAKPNQQENPVPDELRVISQPQGQQLADIASYAYEDEVMGQVMIYIIDSGIDKSFPPPPSATNGFPVQFLYPGSASDQYDFYEPYNYIDAVMVATNPDLNTDWTGHGTCMAAKAVGEQFGVSKNAALTIVRIPEGRLTPDEQARGRKYAVRYGPYVDAFRLVLEDVRAKNLQGRAVINLSSGFPDSAGRIPIDTDDDWELYDIISQVVDEKVVVVVGSGNLGTFRGTDPSQPPNAQTNPVANPNAKQINSVPALWNNNLALISVGAVNNDGVVLDLTQYQANPNFFGSGADVYAPGALQTCPGVGGQLVQRVGMTSVAAAYTTGLVAYFLGVPYHLQYINAYFNNLPADQQNGNGWARVVRHYITLTAYVRATPAGASVPNFANVLYNREIPLNLNQQPVCQIPQNAKRQDDPTPSCVSPASATALSASAASASVASASLASLASVASVSSASLASASIASASSASAVSVVSVSSAEARSSRLATMTAPLPTFTGYLGDQCNSNQDFVLNTGVANATIQQFCTGFWSWPGPSTPPNNVPGVDTVSGANITFKSTPPSSPNMEIGTELIVGPYDGPGACSVGGYPRSIGIAECIAGFSTVFSWCLDGGGAIIWLTSDTQGCVIFEIDQSGAGLQPVSAAPSATSAAPAPSSVAPPPPPQPTTGVISHTCNDQGGSDGYIALTSDVSTAVLSFCPDANNFMTNTGPSENKIVGPTDDQMQLNLALSTDGVFPGGCSTATAGDADLAVADCINVLSAAAQCIYGGIAIWQLATGVCVQGIINMENLN